ncbi:MAG: recombination protein O N-terminal domain-containing protein [Spirochaetaceae bacterium]|jgi:DNA repair protein RecO (recombination protein O)|nr:recombination protein O N-terminal domain-containing protein [Spirochaetaceae bacterium]
MSRNKSLFALALRTRKTGESNREAYFLTAEFGILRATVYGGPKSKLRAYVLPYHSGVLYLYHDGVRDSYKVTDFDVRCWRPGLSEVYERTITAAALAETVLAGHGGGIWHEALALILPVLDTLEDAGAEDAGVIFVYFLWKWTAIIGVRPELNAIHNAHPEAARLLALLDKMPPEAVPGKKPDGTALVTAKGLCVQILTGAYGRRLASWSL